MSPTSAQCNGRVKKHDEDNDGRYITAKTKADDEQLENASKLRIKILHFRNERETYKNPRTNSDKKTRKRFSSPSPPQGFKP